MKKPIHDERWKGPRGDSNKPRGVIVHTTEGAFDVAGPTERYGVIDYLAGSRNLSVPVVVDEDGSTEMVPPPNHGEHAGCVDGCFGIEQCARAGWTPADWEKHDKTVKHAAQWTAWYLAERIGVAVNEDNLKKLVVGHDRDHVFGGCSDHWDPGPNYPWARFRRYAIDYATQVGYRVVAVKGERKIVKNYRARLPKRAISFIRKRTKRGWRVVTRKRRYRGDLDFD